MLTATGLRAGYGRLEVLHGVDIVIPPGRTVALLGANGAGKSTLLKAIAGLLPAMAGTVQLDGQDVTMSGADHRARAGVCLLPEGRGIFRHLTVRDNVAMFIRSRHIDEHLDRIAGLFPKLIDRLDQVAGTLSGGEQQMLSVSRAVLTDAETVLADELSVGLAPKVIDEIFEVVGVLRASNRSLLIVEQYADRVLAVADYVYLLDKGSIVFVGEPAQLRDDDLFERYVGQSSARTEADPPGAGARRRTHRRQPLRAST